MNRILANLDDVTVDEPSGFGALETARGRLPLVALDVKTRISDLTAQTTVRQTFRNALDVPLEASYIFPLPDRAAVTEFQMHVADRTLAGILKERSAAREEYDRAIDQGHRAAIAEEDRSGVFNMRVGNIPPNEQATVELTLVGPLPIADGEATFRFPLVVAPRYTPGIPLDGASVGAGVTPDTDEVPDASRVTPPVLLPGFPNPVRLSLEVQLDELQPDSIANVRSSLHSIITESGTIRLQPGERLDRDFILRFAVSGAMIGTSLKFSPATKGRPGVFALTLLPPLGRGKAVPRDVVFVLDRSGSMSGWKMVAARRALGRMIDTLLDQDRFGVLAFDNVIERRPNSESTLVSGTNRERWRTVEWLGGIEARGGTEMRSALKEAVKLLKKQGRTNAEQILVVVTDGQVAGEDAILRKLSKNDTPRIFSVGIDRAVNAGFLRRLADIGRGSCELVESEGRLDEAMDRIHRLIGTPVLTNVRLKPVDFDWVSDSLSPIPDLFTDRPVTVYGRHTSSDTSIRLLVEATDTGGKAWADEVAARMAPAKMLTSMWGRAKVRELEDKYAAGRQSKKLMKQIVDVSLESHVLSRFTAYVAVDRSEVVNEGGRLQQIVQPVELPDGWEMPAAYARAPAAGRMRRSRMFGKVAHLALPAFDAVELDAADSMLCESADSVIDFTLQEELLAETDGDSESIKRLVQMLIEEAVRRRATEILIELLEDRIRLQFLINGEFDELPAAPLHFFHAIVAGIKTLAKMDGENEGRITLTLGKKEVVLDVRISSSSRGESVHLVFVEDEAKISQP
jgi:Ca-activated chloride channel family protein